MLTSYLRFRINYDWTNNFDKKGETRFNDLLKNYFQQDVSCYGMFMLGWGSDIELGSKVSEFLNKYKAKIIITESGNIAGIMFGDAKHKEIFLLRYKEYFPDNSLIK